MFDEKTLQAYTDYKLLREDLIKRVGYIKFKGIELGDVRVIDNESLENSYREYHEKRDIAEEYITEFFYSKIREKIGDIDELDKYFIDRDITAKSIFSIAEKLNKNQSDKQMIKYTINQLRNFRLGEKYLYRVYLRKDVKDIERLDLLDYVTEFITVIDQIGVFVVNGYVKYHNYNFYTYVDYYKNKKMKMPYLTCNVKESNLRKWLQDDFNGLISINDFDYIIAERSEVAFYNLCVFCALKYKERRSFFRDKNTSKI